MEKKSSPKGVDVDRIEKTTAHALTNCTIRVCIFCSVDYPNHAFMGGTESEDSDYYALAYYSMSSPKRVFGISLEFLRRRGQMRQGVPVVLLQMVEFLDQYGLHQSELFHASRSEARRNELKKSLNRGEFQCFRSSDAHAVASLLILFLRELPYGLIPCWNATRFLRVYTKTKGKVLDLKHAKTVLNSFEPEIFNALCLLIHFLSRVAAQSHVNHMTSKHLSEVFGPCIFHVSDSRIKPVEQQLCIYLTQQLIDNVTFLLPNTYPPKHTSSTLSTGDCHPSPSPASLSVDAAKKTLLSDLRFSRLSVIW
ncbi:Protein FAM13A [Labeo rohita]|uniref:Protein FAM13A n=1 Tax=Labeo rohita TaxID=84645 RepID=A0ABQ8LH36_LABRO|nr:Protein FAM13A [Labeo rohita]